MLDLFSGIGGFHLGLEQAGFEFNWVGFSEIDKYAIKQYKRRFPDAEELGDIKSIRPERLPDIDLVTFGFPCQDLSIAGKRGGLQANRSSLFFEAMRIIGAKKPKYFIFENVKGLFSSNEGQDFDLILRTIADFGYDGGWQLLNTRWFLPQNRERVYFVGHIRGEPRPEVFPIGEGNKQTDELQGQFTNTLKARYEAIGDGSYIIEGEQYAQEGLKQIGTIGEDSEATRVYDTSGCSRTIKNGGGMGAKTGLYQVGELKVIAKKRTYDTPPEINEYLKKYKKGTIKQIAEQLELPKTQVEHFFRSDTSRAIPSPEIWLQLKEMLGFDDTYDKQVTDIYEKEVEFESSRRVYSAEGDSPTLDTSKKGGLIQVLEQSKIRRLTPTECERLQGFPDGWTEGQSDTQRYKQLGNAVSVPVVKAIGERLNQYL